MLNARLLTRNEIDAAAWDTFVDRSPQQAIYANSWYLDSVCPDWSAIVVEGKDGWEAVMPLNQRKKYGVGYATPPFYTQYLGVLLRPDSKKKSRVYGHLKNVLNKVIETFPSDLKLFDQNFHPSQDYMLPFLWAGFTVSPRYTYELELAHGYDKVVAGFTSSVKSDLKRVVREEITCEESQSIAELSNLLKAKQLIGEEEAKGLGRLWKEVVAREKGVVLQGRNKEGELMCAAAFLFDKTRTIYLLSAARPGPQMGSNTLLIAKAIEKSYAREGVTEFDFEGSMLEPVEHYFRAFNPRKKIYYHVSRNTLSWLYRMGFALKRKSSQ